MDYKYIEMLLERYWACDTSLEEEEILRAFFSQKDVPSSLKAYKDLFVYEHEAQKTERLGDDFDQKMLDMIADEEPAKARTVSLKAKLMPLFRAAAVVAIILTLGNAMQMATDQHDNSAASHIPAASSNKGASVAVVKSDSMKLDTLQKTGVVQPGGIVK